MHKAVRVFSQKISDVHISEVYDLIIQGVKRKEKRLFFPLNVHIFLKLRKDVAFKKKLERAATVIFSDGVPLIWLSRGRISRRVSGTDLAEQILENNSIKIFIIGSDASVVTEISKKYCNVVGFYIPPFNNEWFRQHDDNLIHLINISKANVIFVGITPLKQEHWLINNFSKLKAQVGIPIGSALEILVKRQPRAPKLLRDSGLEWLWRIYLEPRRLGKRYFFDALELLLLIVSFWLDKQKRKMSK